MIDRIQDSVEPAVMAGMNLAVIPGDEMNFRIETPVDLERLKLLSTHRNHSRCKEREHVLEQEERADRSA